MGKQAKHTTCSTCGKEHYASFAECPYCLPEQAEANPDPGAEANPDADADTQDQDQEESE
jgi:hypothetical protein